MRSDDKRMRLSPEESVEITHGFERSFKWIKNWVCFARWIPIFGALLLCVVYAGDFVLIQYRMATANSAFGVVTINRYYKIHLKNGKFEYDSADPVDQTCVRSLFPHSGYSPCWYLNRNRQQPIEF